MRPIVTDEVAWSVCQSVGLSVSHDCEPCKNGWTDRDVVWDAQWSETKTHLLDGGPDSHAEGQFWGGKGQSIEKYRDHLPWALQQTAEPIEMPFVAWTPVGPRKHVLDRSIHWRNLVNTMNRPCATAMRSFCQITLTTCYKSVNWQFVMQSICFTYDPTGH